MVVVNVESISENHTIKQTQSETDTLPIYHGNAATTQEMQSVIVKKLK